MMFQLQHPIRETFLDPAMQKHGNPVSTAGRLQWVCHRTTMHLLCQDGSSGGSGCRLPPSAPVYTERERLTHIPTTINLMRCWKHDPIFCTVYSPLRNPKVNRVLYELRFVPAVHQLAYEADHWVLMVIQRRTVAIHDV